MTFPRGIGDPDPVGGERLARQGPVREERRVAGSGLLAVGTLACPRCDAPVAPPARSLAPAEALECPFCAHAAAVRDFLSLAAPSRPARVAVRVAARAGRAGR